MRLIVQLDLGHVTIDLESGHVVSTDGQRIALTTRERAVLIYLVERRGTDVARTSLERDVFGQSPQTLSRAVDATIARLRHKVEFDPGSPRHLLTVHGSGYRWAPLHGGGPAWQVAHTDTRARALGRLRLSDRIVDLDRSVVELGAGCVALTAAERFLLERLARAERPVGPTELVPGRASAPVAAERVARTVHRLRRKVELHPDTPCHLIHVRGAGYRLYAETIVESMGERFRSVAFAVCRHAGAILGLEDFVVYVRDGQVMRQIAAHGPKNPRGDALVNPLVLAAGRGIVGAAAALATVQYVVNTAEDARYVPDGVPGRSELAVPIRIGREVVGVLDSEHRAPGAFGEDHGRAFESLAAILAAAVGTL